MAPIFSLSPGCSDCNIVINVQLSSSTRNGRPDHCVRPAPGNAQSLDSAVQGPPEEGPPASDAVAAQLRQANVSSDKDDCVLVLPSGWPAATHT